MSKLDEINERIKKHKETEYGTAICNQYQFSNDVEYLLSLIKQAENTLHEVAKATKFLQHIPVMGLVYELSETNLIAIRGR